jgi:hypothetical protein
MKAVSRWGKRVTPPGHRVPGHTRMRKEISPHPTRRHPAQMHTPPPGVQPRSPSSSGSYTARRCDSPGRSGLPSRPTAPPPPRHAAPDQAARAPRNRAALAPRPDRPQARGHLTPQARRAATHAPVYPCAGAALGFAKTTAGATVASTENCSSSGSRLPRRPCHRRLARTEVRADDPRYAGGHYDERPAGRHRACQPESARQHHPFLPWTRRRDSAPHH